MVRSYQTRSLSLSLHLSLNGAKLSTKSKILGHETRRSLFEIGSSHVLKPSSSVFCFIPERDMTYDHETRTCIHRRNKMTGYNVTGGNNLVLVFLTDTFCSINFTCPYFEVITLNITSSKHVSLLLFELSMNKCFNR